MALAGAGWGGRFTGETWPQDRPAGLLFEVHSWTGFLDVFTYVCARPARMGGLLVSLVALLVLQRCDIGLTPVVARTAGR